MPALIAPRVPHRSYPSWGTPYSSASGENEVTDEVARAVVLWMGPSVYIADHLVTSGFENDGPEVRAIPWLGYLRSIWTLFWTAIRHPLTTTAIDLSTGRVVAEEPPNGEGAKANHLV